MIGERIGAYKILRQIGEGGMGSVWLAEHAMLERRAAIKMLHASVSGQPDTMARFFNEAKAAAAIQDPGIVQIFDFGYHTDGRAYIVMELLEGESLEGRLQRLGRLPLGNALRVVRQVASSLGAAHARGIVHRDLKPDNIFLVRDAEVQGGERAKVLDFGIAKIADASGMKTSPLVVIGTPSFMSPEQCRGGGQVDARSDVYSLGCLLFMLLTGRAPFVGAGPGDIIAMHLREPPPAPSSLVPELPRGVDALVLRCMEKEPSRRYSSGSEIAEVLEALSAGNTGRILTQDVDPGASAKLPQAAHATTLSSYAQASQRPPPAPRSSGRGWLITGGVTTALAIALIAITTMRDAEEAERAQILASLPPPVKTVIAEEQPEKDLSPEPPDPSPAPRTDPDRTVAPADKIELDPEPPAPRVPPPPPKPGPEARPGEPPAPAPGKASAPTRTVRPDIDLLATCADQRTKLEDLIDRSYSMQARQLVQAAKALTFDCFNDKQRLRLAMVVVPAACDLDDKPTVVRFIKLAPSPAVSAKCTKLFGEQ